jgi:hypothetical protein
MPMGPVWKHLSVEETLIGKELQAILFFKESLDNLEPQQRRRVIDYISALYPAVP